MARRKRKSDSLGLLLFLLVGGIFWAVSRALDSVGVAGVVLGSCLVVGLFVWYRHHKYQERLAYLRGKYGDEEIVRRVLAHLYWQGQTVEQLRDSLGNPPSIDDNLLKTRKREVWKYQPNGVNRYRLRITLDNDVVVSWDHKK